MLEPARGVKKAQSSFFTFFMILALQESSPRTLRRGTLTSENILLEMALQGAHRFKKQQLTTMHVVTTGIDTKRLPTT